MRSTIGTDHSLGANINFNFIYLHLFEVAAGLPSWPPGEECGCLNCV